MREVLQAEEGAVTRYISNHSGQPFEKVEKDGDRDYWMIADEAKAYGMIDETARTRSTV